MESYRKFLENAEAARPASLRCEKHDSTYPQGGSCYYCRTGYEPKDMGKDSMPMLDRPRLRTAGPSKNFGGMEEGCRDRGLVGRHDSRSGI